MTARDYRDLLVWQRAMELVELIYRLTQSFPREELYGLTSQIRRAAVSVPCNIAEGQGRRSTREFLGFLSIARGSLKEVETQILIAERLKYIDQQHVRDLLESTAQAGRLLTGLAKSLRTKLD